MAEAKEGYAVLKEVDEGTFIRFAQWAYNGYYSAAEHKVMPDDNHKKYTVSKKSGEHEELFLGDEDEEPILYSYSTGNPIRSAPSKVAKGRGNCGKAYLSESTSSMRCTRDGLKEAFLERKYRVLRNSTSISPPRANRDSNENYADVFLSHARLYVFAEQYDIQPLKTLAFEQLQLTLTDFHLYPERTGDIIGLLRYIYDNTGESAAGIEDLRTLLTAYMSYEMDTLMEDEEFKELMFFDGGALLGDFMSVVKKRI